MPKRPTHPRPAAGGPSLRPALSRAPLCSVVALTGGTAAPRHIVKGDPDTPWSRRDRRFFATNKPRTCYMRPTFNGEWPEDKPASVTGNDDNGRPGELVLMTLVRRLNSRKRLRARIWVHPQHPRTEPVCRALWEVMERAWRGEAGLIVGGTSDPGVTLVSGRAVEQFAELFAFDPSADGWQQ